MMPLKDAAESCKADALELLLYNVNYKLRSQIAAFDLLVPFMQMTMKIVTSQNHDTISI
jgi:hypothetical protein